MKTGMNLLLWTGDPFGDNVPALCERIKEWEFEGAELPLLGDPGDAQCRTLAHVLDDLGLERTAVTIVHKDANPLSDDAGARAGAVAHLKRVIDACHTLGVEVLCGPFVSPVGHLVGRGRTDDEWGRAVAFFQQIAPHAQQAGVLLVLEALNRFETYFVNCMADLALLVDAVGHASFQLMYDTFHAHIEEKNVRGAIRTAGKRIAHVHISENDRSTPGEGQVNWTTTFSWLREIGYDDWLVIEAFGTAVPEIAAATSIWRPMFPNEEHVATRGLAFIQQQWERAGFSAGQE